MTTKDEGKLVEITPEIAQTLLQKIKPIDPKYVPSTLGTREGSNDHKEWRSKYND